MSEPVLFAAIFPPPEALETITAIQQELKQKLEGKGKLTWVAPERMHVTMFFLGAHKEEHAQEWVERALVARPKAFELQLTEISMKRHRFGDGHRSLFLSAEECKPLVAIARRLNWDVSKPPHLTLARFRKPIEPPSMAIEPITFLAKQIALVQSVKEGADFGYRTLKEWPLNVKQKQS